MGTELAAASAAARDVFEEVDDALSLKLSAIMRDGPEDQLTLTENAPAGDHGQCNRDLVAFWRASLASS